MTKWHEQVPRPPLDNMIRIGGHKEWQVFVNAGEGIASVLIDKARDLLGDDLKGKRILDFGCGVGRIAMPFYFQTDGALTHACDIDDSAVNYLKTALPNVDVQTTPFKPRLPYDDNSFDLVYSISIWTHLTEEDQKLWLNEMQRIVRLGGYILPSTSSYKAIEHRKNQGIPSWMDTMPEELTDAGILYKESLTLNNPTHKVKYFPGIEGSYGQTSNTKEYIAEHWDQYFEVVSFHENAIGGVQDMNVLRRR